MLAEPAGSAHEFEPCRTVSPTLDRNKTADPKRKHMSAAAKAHGRAARGHGRGAD